MTDELKRRHLALPEDVWRQVKSRAAIEGITIADYITKLIRTEIITPVYRGETHWDMDQSDPWGTKGTITKVEPGTAPRSTSTPDVAIGSFGHSSPAPKTRKTK